MKRSLILTALSFLVLAQLAWAQVPQIISYQGVLKDNSGNIVADGNYDITLRIYDVETFGTPLWSELQTAVPVADGVFSVILGKVPGNPLPGPFPAPAWLAIKVDPDANEMTPRIELTAVPYSLSAMSVTGADNFFPSSGSVGIGTTAPYSSQQLHIYDAAQASILITGEGDEWNYSGLNLGSGANNKVWGLLHGKVTGMENYFYIQEYDGATYSPRLVVQPGGDVGIGTTTPERKLHIVSPDGDGIQLSHSISGDIGATLLNWETMGGQLALYDVAGGGVGARIRGYGYDGVQAYFTAGNVGIGTTTPDALFQTSVAQVSTGQWVGAFSNDVSDINGNYDVGIRFSFGDLGDVSPGEGGKWGGILYVSESSWANSGGMAFYTHPTNSGGVERMRIDANGFVGIGTDSPTAKLDVVGNANIQGNLVASGDVSTQGVLTTLGAASIGGAITIPATTRYYSIPAAEFNPYTYSSGNVPYIADETMGMMPYDISAPVHLPHGAIITEFSARVYDGHTVENITVSLMYAGAFADAYTNIITMTSDWDGGNVTLENGLPPHTVDNINNVYVVTASWVSPVMPDQAEIKFRNVLIGYTVNQPLP